MRCFKTQATILVLALLVLLCDWGVPVFAARPKSTEALDLTPSSKEVALKLPPPLSVTKETSPWRKLFLQEESDTLVSPQPVSPPLPQVKPSLPTQINSPLPQVNSPLAGEQTKTVSTLPSSEERSLWDLLSEAVQQLNKQMENDTGTASVHKILGTSCTTPGKRKVLAVTQHAEADALRQKTGLELRASYVAGDLTEDPGDADAYLELSWDLLRNGYYENRVRATALHHRARVTALRGSVSQAKRRHRCRRTRIADHFAALYAELLQMQLQVMEPVHAIERRAYFKGWSFLDDYLVSEEDLHLLRRELQYLHGDSGTESILKDLINPPLIDIDLSGLIAAIRNDPRNSQITALEKEALSERRKARYHNRLRIFLRQSFAVGGRGSREGVGLGIRFQLPFDPPSDEVDRLKLQQVNASHSVEEWERVAQTRSAYQRLRQETAHQIKLSYRYERAHERVRQVLVKKNLGDEPPLTVAVTRIRSLLSSAVAKLRSKVTLYQRANDVFMAAGIDYRPELIQISVPEGTGRRARLGERAIYLWSEAFNSIPNQQILDFFEAKQIKTVLLSAGSRTDRVKLEQFSVLADQKNWDLSLIIGANKWIFPQHHNRAAATIASAAELTGRVHLDIEPHTLEGYQREHPETFLNHYVDLLIRARELLGDQHLSISVPLHWNIATYEKVGPLADEIYIMSYGSGKPATIIRRLRPVLKALPPDKTVVVLRVDDFEDEWAMEGAIEQIYAQTGIHRFAIHQFKTFIKKAGMQP